MLNFDDCKKLAKAFVSKKNEENETNWDSVGQSEQYNELALSDWNDQSKFCFAFAWNSKKYLESNNLDDCLVGHGPVIIDRRNGKIIETGSNYPSEAYLENYEKRGDPYKNAGKTVRILEELSDKQRVYAIKSVRNLTDLGLKGSKEGIEKVIDGGSFDVEAVSNEAAAQLVQELTDFNYSSERL